MENNDKKGLSLGIRPEAVKGTYSNLAIITHSGSEFILDFAQMLPGLQRPEVSERIIMAPEHAKRLYMALQDNIIKYENQFGVIDIDSKKPRGGTFNIEDFGGFGNGPKS